MDLDYPGFAARYTVRYANARVLEGRPYGIAFYGTKGTLVVDRASYEVIPETTPRPRLRYRPRAGEPGHPDRRHARRRRARAPQAPRPLPRRSASPSR